MSKVEFLKEFAEKIGCVLITKGEVGFGRPCVGILEPDIEHYVDINPFDHEAYFKEESDEYDSFYTFKYSEDLEPDSDLVPSAYHKHSCMAVLVCDENYDKALSELYEWVSFILSKGEVECRKHSEVDVKSLDPIEQIFATPYKVALVYKED